MNILWVFNNSILVWKKGEQEMQLANHKQKKHVKVLYNKSDN